MTDSVASTREFEGLTDPGAPAPTSWTPRTSGSASWPGT